MLYMGDVESGNRKGGWTVNCIRKHWAEREDIMKGIVIWTLINMAESLSVAFNMMALCRKAVSLGWQETGFSLSLIKLRRGRIFDPYLYGVNFYYGGAAYFMVVKKEEYARLLTNRTGKLMAYVREFPAWYLNPNFEKCEFSLHEVDWWKRDRKKCIGGGIYMFIALEALTVMMALQL